MDAEVDSNAVGKCWEVLPEVSRSFALCIRILPKPLDEQMMISYLAYRVIDTIEDSSASLARKKAQFSKFLGLLSGNAVDAEETMKVRGEFLAGLDCTYEKKLLFVLEKLVAAYYMQPALVRRSILKWGNKMAGGMCKFQNRQIRTFHDQNSYSYYVAGVVGYLFNDLLYYNGIIGKRLQKRLHGYARKFGLALQKVNILRDVAADIMSGRKYWPEKLMEKYGLDYASILLEKNREKALLVLRAEIENARKYLDAGIRYVLSLPKNATRVRMFCLIPLFMAIESYAKCMDNWEIFRAGTTVKIGRMKVQEIVAKATLWAASDERIAQWFSESVSARGFASPSIAPAR